MAIEAKFSCLLKKILPPKLVLDLIKAFLMVLTLGAFVKKIMDSFAMVILESILPSFLWHEACKILSSPTLGI